MDEQTTTPLRTDTPHRDLREFIDRVEGVGELKRIRGAHWDLEMGCLAELVYQSGQEQPPAILFEDIPGYPGFRCVAGLTNRSEEHTSELQSLMRISYAVFCLKKKKKKPTKK